MCEWFNFKLLSLHILGLSNCFKVLHTFLSCNSIRHTSNSSISVQKIKVRKLNLILHDFGEGEITSPKLEIKIVNKILVCNYYKPGADTIII